jgi:regulator of sigma E protease
MELAIQIGQFLLSLSILIVLHEFGHFLAARAFNTKVEKFYLFFNPWFTLYKKQIGETEWGIGWLPLGGYVKIAGMIDESMDKEQLKQPPQPWEFRSKPAWQRLIIMLGGIIVNVIVGILIYSMTLMVWGERHLPMSELKDGIWAVDTSVTNIIGIKTGDKILAIDGDSVKYFDELFEQLIVGKEITVQRNGNIEEIKVPTNFVEQLLEKKKPGIFIYPRIPFVVGSIADNYVAKDAGLQLKDQIVGINNDTIRYFDEYKLKVIKYADKDVVLKVIRKDKIVQIPIHIPDSAILGVQQYLFSLNDLERAGIYHFEYKKYGFLESFPAGVEKAWKTLVNYYKQFKMILSPSTGAYKGLGGFASISKLFGTEWNWQNFWDKTAFISLVLAFMNLLPIPALDGGHVMFVLYEMITGRKPNEKVLEYAQILGFIFLLLVLFYVNGMDVVRGCR